MKLKKIQSYGNLIYSVRIENNGKVYLIHDGGECCEDTWAIYECFPNSRRLDIVASGYDHIVENLFVYKKGKTIKQYSEGFENKLKELFEKKTSNKKQLKLVIETLGL